MCLHIYSRGIRKGKIDSIVTTTSGSHSGSKFREIPLEIKTGQQSVDAIKHRGQVSLYALMLSSNLSVTFSPLAIGVFARCSHGWVLQHMEAPPGLLLYARDGRMSHNPTRFLCTCLHRWLAPLTVCAHSQAAFARPSESSSPS